MCGAVRRLGDWRLEEVVEFAGLLAGVELEVVSEVELGADTLS